MATLVGEAEIVGTAAISFTEVTAALAQAARLGVLDAVEAEEALGRFREEWPDLIRLSITEFLSRAVDLAWRLGLRGYDAVQLAAAQIWQEALGETITLATFDRQFWESAPKIGLAAYPADSPDLRTAKETPDSPTRYRRMARARSARHQGAACAGD
jgi:predicted nucleic acid-binding protein